MASAVKTVVALAVISVSLCGKWVAAEVNHLVGGDHGWDSSTDVASWSSGRTFRIGDKICKLFFPPFFLFHFLAADFRLVAEKAN